MKKLPFFIAFLMLGLFSSTAILTAQSTNADATGMEEAGMIQGIICKVDKVADKWALIPVEDEGQRFIPTELDLKYRKPGLKVQVSGMSYNLPPNVRALGTPLRIDRIDVAETGMQTGGVKPAKGATTKPPTVQPPKQSPAPSKETAPKVRPAQKTTPSKTTVPSERGEMETGGFKPAKNTKKTTLTDVEGKIVVMGDKGFFIQSDDGKRYKPVRLERAFHVRDMRVRFSGTTTPPPPNVKMMGQPLNITSIEKIVDRPGSNTPTKKAPKKSWWQFWK